MTGPTEGTEALLDALDRLREVRGSLAIFDGLVADDPALVASALAAHRRHPLHARVLAWLAEQGVSLPPPESPADALARHGIEDVDGWVEAAHQREAALARALDTARAERELALRSANAYALFCALLALLAIGGWVAAMEGFPSFQEPEIAKSPTSKDAPAPEPKARR